MNPTQISSVMSQKQKPTSLVSALVLKYLEYLNLALTWQVILANVRFAELNDLLIR